jgi:hypothetical protein
METVVAKLDTGADVCAIPLPLAERLALLAVGRVEVAGWSGPGRPAELFLASLAFDSRSFERVTCLTSLRPYALLGRNVLNQVAVLFDGPSRRFSFGRPRSRVSR